MSKLPILLLILMFGLVRANGEETNYFLVAERRGQVFHHDSYVLPLSKPEDIAYARYLIVKNQAGFSEGDRGMVGAKLAAGKDGINRNLVDPAMPEWSWHVREFGGVGEGAIETLDGNPTQVENDPSWY